MSTIVRSASAGSAALAATTLSGTTVVLTAHAVERYQQRVKPHLSLEDAAADLQRLIPEGARLLQAPPSWVRNAESYRSDYVALGPDVVFPIERRTRDLSVITCLTPYMRSRPQRAPTWRPRGDRKPRRPRLYIRPRGVLVAAYLGAEL